MARITGRVDVIVNGIPLLNKAGAVARGLGLSGQPNMEREAIIGDGGLHGYVERPIMAECEVTITDRDDVSLNDLAAINGDGTVTYRASGGGKAYVMNNATCLMNLDITGGDGETTIKFQGPYWEEDVWTSVSL